MVNVEELNRIRAALPLDVTLVAVSKTKPVSDIELAYAEGVRDFGENRVQELVEKHSELPTDIRWHAIGNLQRNKAKVVVPIASLVHAVDSTRLFDALARHATQPLDVLLQIHIAREDTKHGFLKNSLLEHLEKGLLSHPQLRIRGLMGMATFTDDEMQIAKEFKCLRKMYEEIAREMGAKFDILSMGMSGDWKIAVDEGSTLIRVGSAIFGSR